METRRRETHWLSDGLRGIGLVAAATLVLAAAGLLIAFVVAWTV